MTPAIGVSGALTSALYIPTLSQYFRPLSTTSGFCPADTIAGAYQCDFRCVASAASGSSGISDNITVPSNLVAIYAKLWGAGGGGSDSATDGEDTGGGSGGSFCRSPLKSINSTAIAGQALDVYVGGFGTHNPSESEGRSAAAEVRAFISTPVLSRGLRRAAAAAAVTATAKHLSRNRHCSSVRTGRQRRRAPGSPATAHAPDNNLNLGCGGRGGDNTTFGFNLPTATNVCDDGGKDPTGKTGVLVARTAALAEVRTFVVDGSPFIGGGDGYDGVTEKHPRSHNGHRRRRRRRRWTNGATSGPGGGGEAGGSCSQCDQ